MRRIRSGCCARAASGHADAAPPSIVMNSRRLIASPEAQNHAKRQRKGTTPVADVERGWTWVRGREYNAPFLRRLGPRWVRIDRLASTMHVRSNPNNVDWSGHPARRGVRLSEMKEATAYFDGLGPISG